MCPPSTATHPKGRPAAFAAFLIASRCSGVGGSRCARLGLCPAWSASLPDVESERCAFHGSRCEQPKSLQNWMNEKMSILPAAQVRWKLYEQIERFICVPPWESVGHGSYRQRQAVVEASERTNPHPYAPNAGLLAS